VVWVYQIAPRLTSLLYYVLYAARKHGKPDQIFMMPSLFDQLSLIPMNLATRSSLQCHGTRQENGSCSTNTPHSFHSCRSPYCQLSSEITELSRSSVI